MDFCAATPAEINMCEEKHKQPHKQKQPQQKQLRSQQKQ